MYQAFSDGACKGNPGPGGWGCVVETPDGQTLEAYGNKGLATNNQMELMGAVQALRLAPAGSTVCLTTDSQYVINGITKWIEGWKRRDWQSSTGGTVKNQDLWLLLDAEVQTRTVSWKWVRGHTGHPQNERCDHLGNMAIAELSVNNDVEACQRHVALCEVKSLPAAKRSDPALGIEAAFEL